MILRMRALFFAAKRIALRFAGRRRLRPVFMILRMRALQIMNPRFRRILVEESSASCGRFMVRANRGYHRVKDVQSKTF